MTVLIPAVNGPDYIWSMSWHDQTRYNIRKYHQEELSKLRVNQPYTVFKHTEYVIVSGPNNSG